MIEGGLLQMSGIMVDLIYQVDAVPNAGDDLRAKKLISAPGGGFNAMIAAKRTGYAVSYGGAHGTGPFADLTRDELAKAGIETLQKQSRIADQGVCVVMVDGGGERTFIWKEGADSILDDRALSEVDARVHAYTLLSGYALSHEGSRDMLSQWIARLPSTSCLVFDPTPIIGDIPKPIVNTVLDRTSWISANRAETAIMTGIASPEAAAGKLATMIGRCDGGAIVRCGADGCWIAPGGDEPVHVPGFKVDAIDTNGAGDCHIGAFIGMLGAGTNPAEAARYANAAAALSTTKFGPATAPAHGDALRLIKSQDVPGERARLTVDG